MLLLRAIVTGFGLAFGAALFKKHVQPRLGLDDPAEKKKTADERAEQQREGAVADPDLHEQHA